ncbi:MAG: phospho-N-acetylmuramoyl-pentapeptide-transferase [Candidatus Dadabacteria bacterium]|nr:phospho-N-acetylmuramoyl-pentapeptide-transferase [Candidatus Dadabacteria bacterium]MCY4047805.1 phospho-N-acetylmuramoyl-pentapeptide-transferase [Candidatus Dadabacteria bacterium]
MLYLLHLLKDDIALLNVFKYVTFRSFGAGVFAFFLSVLLGGRAISFLNFSRIREKIRPDGPEGHMAKSGTPTMGGLFIVLAVALSTLLWGNPAEPVVMFSVVFISVFGLIGFADDRMKLYGSKGMRAGLKFLVQCVAGVVLVMVFLRIQGGEFEIYERAGHAANVYSFTSVALPFVKSAVFELGWLYFVLALLVIIGTSNAVNLTDGLDGLAIGSVIISVGAYYILAFVAGNATLASYLHIPYVRSAAEFAVFLAAVGGACLGFLWYNAYPARVFMGDSGSLALGASIGLAALVTKQESLLVLIGGIFVAETLSVIAQVGFFRLKGRRLFRMSPLHHHFEKAGWHESQVVIRFWVLSFVLALVALATLKVR